MAQDRELQTMIYVQVCKVVKVAYLLPLLFPDVQHNA